MQKVGIKSSGWTNEIYIYAWNHQVWSPAMHHVAPRVPSGIGADRPRTNILVKRRQVVGHFPWHLWSPLGHAVNGRINGISLRNYTSNDLHNIYNIYIYNMILIHWTINISKENWKQILSILPFRINISTSMLSNPSSLCTASCLLALGRSHLIRTPECRATPPAARLGFSARWNDCYDGV